MFNLYLIEAESSLRPDWTEYAKAPQAPANYKDAAKIQAYVDAKRETLEKDIEENTALSDIHKIRVATYSPSEKDVFGNLFTDITSRMPVIVIGNRARTLLNWIVRNEKAFGTLFWETGDDDYALESKRIRFYTDLTFGNTRCIPLEDFLFSAKERELLLTDKLISVKRADYRNDINYMRAAMQSLGFRPEWFQITTYDVDKDNKYGNER